MSRPHFLIHSTILAALLTPCAGAQCEQEKLLASDGVDLGNFGAAISLDGDLALIGAFGHVIIPGKGYIRRLVGSQWVEEAILDPASDLPSSSAGYAVALKGDLAVLGAPYNDTNGIGNSGAVYVFEHQGGGSWLEVATLLEPTVQPNNRFGNSLAIDGDSILIGSPESGASNQGLVYVYTKQAGSWAGASVTAILSAQDAQANDFFGGSMSLDGAQLAVGAELEDESATNSGAVYVFERAGATWSSSTSIAKLRLGNPLVRDQLGASVCIRGSRLLAGAPGDASNDPGAAYHWDRVGSTWVDATETGSMFPTIFGGMRLGVSVAFLADSAYVGGNASYTGNVRRYLWDGASWGAELPITPPDAGIGETFGSSLAMRGDELWVGAYSHREGTTRVGAVFRSTPRHEFNYCVGAPNSVGLGARLSTCGSTSVAANDLMLVVSGAPKNQPGIFFYGALAVQVPFGDGFRCVGGAMHRLVPIINTDQAGGYYRPLDVHATPSDHGPGLIDAGSSWNFQFWHRDPAGPGGNAFNLSDAVSVTFTP